jgi:hypothetical protein
VVLFADERLQMCYRLLMKGYMYVVDSGWKSSSCMLKITNGQCLSLFKVKAKIFT